MSGFFISLEGIDGAGKSSHLEAIEAGLRAAGRTVCRSREPGGTALAEALRELLLKQPMDALTEALLVFAARRDHVQQVIRPALARGDVVLCDRFTDATFAYQGAGRGFDLAKLDVLEEWVQTHPQRAGRTMFSGGSHPLASVPSAAAVPAGTTVLVAAEAAPGHRWNAVADSLLQPDLTLWFDITPELAAQRLAGARLADRFESEPQAFFARVRAGYAARAQAEPWRFVRIDASQTREAVWDQVHACLAQRGLLQASPAAPGKGECA